MMYRQLSNIMLTTSGVSNSGPDADKDDSLRPESLEKPPEKEPGEIYVIVMSIIGLLLGGSIGYFIASPMVGLFLVILCIVGGAILGGMAGAYIGGRMKDLKIERDKEKKRS
jgi:hypothetical protein